MQVIETEERIHAAHVLRFHSATVLDVLDQSCGRRADLCLHLAEAVTAIIEIAEHVLAAVEFVEVGLEVDNRLLEISEVEGHGRIVGQHEV